MAREEKVWQFARQAGYTPLEDRCIIVKYAPENLSENFQLGVLRSPDV